MGVRTFQKLKIIFIAIYFAYDQAGCNRLQKCVDNDPAACEKLTSQKCAFERPFMTANCSKTCNMCGTNNENFDLDSACLYWRDNKQYCNPGFYCSGVVNKCQYSCNYDPVKRCEEQIPKIVEVVDLKCEDKKPEECKLLTQSKCSFRSEFMSINCKKTCQMCGPKNPNFDYSSLCQYWEKQGYCKKNSSYCSGTVKVCKYTCNEDPTTWCNPLVV